MSGYKRILFRFFFMGQEARSFFKEVARRIVATTNEPRTLQFLQQRVAVAVQRGNAASILGSAVVGGWFPNFFIV